MHSQNKYFKGIKDCKNIKPYLNKQLKDVAYWMFAIRSNKRDKLISFLKEKGIATSVYWIPVPLHPLYYKYKSKIPVARKVWKELVTLPMYSDIKPNQIDFIIKSVKEFDSKN